MAKGKWTQLDGNWEWIQNGPTSRGEQIFKRGKGGRGWVSSFEDFPPFVGISIQIHSMKSVGLFILQISLVFGQSLKNVQFGFPSAWDGDKYPELYCPSKGIPKFLDGFFLCQLSAAYGNPNAPPGQRLTHMIDAIGAIGSFRISNGEVVFSARYYPARPFQIWQFYDRNMSKSSVPWAGWSDYNLTAMSKWENIPPNPDTARFHPNLDFWRIGKRVIAGTEAPYWIGYEFDVGTLTNFTLAHLIEDNDIFGTPRPNLIPISMAMHERADLLDGTIWGTFSAMNFDEERFFQGIFTIDPKGVRKIVGMYDFGVWDSRACRLKDDEYIGDKSQLPGYIHSITSTEHFIILPITSLIINPCKFKEPPRMASSNDGSPHIQAGGLWGMDFYDMVPMRFLIFDKRTRSWITQKPMDVFPSMFVTHQLNAFEDLDGNIVADMIVYDSHDPYVKYFYTDFLRSQLYPSTARVLRFNLDIHSFRVMYSYLVPQETLAVDFPQVNHAFDSRPYQWTYLLEHPFAGGNKILKINVNEPTGKRNIEFKPKEDQFVLHEPYFHPKPGATREDDGILLIRALDLEENKGILLIVDATTMQELGRAFVPISIPFGFHNRFFTSQELGIEKKEVEINNNLRKMRKRPQNGGGPFFGNLDRGFWGRMDGGTTMVPSTTVPPVSWIPIVPGDQDENEEAQNGRYPQKRQQFGRHQIPNGIPMPGPPLSPLLSATPWWPRPSRSPSSSSSTSSSLIPPFAPPSAARQTFTKEEENGGGGGPLTVRQLYERTLRALCKWLPKLLNTISYQGCVSGGQKAIRWMQPFAKKLAHSPEEEENENAGAMDEYGRVPNRGWFRPVLRPPINPNELELVDQKVEENSGKIGGPWYNQQQQRMGRR